MTTAPTPVRRRRAARWLVAGPPPRASRMAGWALLPLRLFLGFTFTFAGLQKLANPTFFNANNPAGIQSQLIAADRSSPLHLLLGHLLQVATPLGVAIALGEVAVGLGVLLGLWTRLAALGGMAIALSLFLTVSFHASPYYTGADIVFFFAFTPLVVAGSGGVLSLDLVLASWARRAEGLAPPTAAVIDFSVVQRLCGHYDDGRCAARRGADCALAPCPVLAERGGDEAAVADARRRTLVLGGVAAGAAAAVALATAGVAAALGRLVGGAKAPSGSDTTTLSGPSPSHPTTTTAPPSAGAGPGTTTTTTPVSVPKGTDIGAAADVPADGSARFTDPTTGGPGLMLHRPDGKYLAYSAVCPHAGCTVGYVHAADLIVCPCHGSEFNPDTGAVVQGPAARGLGVIPVAEGSNGQLYVDG